MDDAAPIISVEGGQITVVTQTVEFQGTVEDCDKMISEAETDISVAQGDIEAANAKKALYQGYKDRIQASA